MRQALELALEALEEAWYHVGTFQPTEKAIDLYDEARAAIKEALAQPEQEPLEYWNAVEGWVKIDEVREHFDSVGCATIYKTAGEGRVPLSLALAQPEQEPVAVVDVHEFYDNCANFSLLQKLPKGKHTLYTTPPQPKEPEPEQEPVAFYVYKPTLPRGHLGNVSDGDLPWVYDQDPSSGYSARMLVHTTPPQRTWVGLTDEEIKELDLSNYVQVVRIVEAKLKEKNG